MSAIYVKTFFFRPFCQSGEIDVVNHTTGDRCHLKFAPYSYFSRDVARKVRGGGKAATACDVWLAAPYFNLQSELAIH